MLNLKLNAAFWKSQNDIVDIQLENQVSLSKKIPAKYKTIPDPEN